MTCQPSDETNAVQATCSGTPLVGFLLFRYTFTLNPTLNDGKKRDREHGEGGVGKFLGG